MIPEDWEVRSLEEITDPKEPICYGIVQVGPFSSNGIPVLAIKNLNTDYRTNVHHCSPEIEAPYARSRVRSGDILISVKGTTGRVGIVPPSFDGNISRDLARIRLSNDHLSEYWLQMLQSDTAQRALDLATVGTTRLEISIGILKQIRLPFPSLSEQRAIAEALSDVDKLLGSLEKLIAKKRAIKQTVMQQLLTGKTRLPDFSGEWETKSFGEVFKRLNGKAHQIQTSEYSTHGLHPVIDQGQDAIAAFSDRTDKLFECLASGVIVFGDHTRIVKFIDVNFLIGADGTQLLTAQGHAVTKFFFYQLLTKDIPNTGYNRHFKFLQDLTFEVPTSEEQKAIAAVLSDMDAEIAALEHRRDKARAVKQGMMQQLLTGRVRLVKPTLSQPVAQEIRG